jgi:putative ABC transport system permease protein
MSGLILYVKMAARNLLKYWRRSLQSAAAIFLGVFLVALVGAFMAGLGARISQDFITGEGHLVVMAPGYAERREMMPLNRLVGGAEAACRALRAAAPGTVAFASLYAPGLVSLGGSPGEAPAGADPAAGESAAVLCAGVMPWFEGAGNPALTAVRQRLAGGSFFEPSGQRGMILSDKKAAAIGACPGDTVIFLCADKFSSFSLIELTLLAVFSGDEFSAEYSCLMDLASLQQVTGAENEAAQLAAFVVDESGTPLEARQAAEPVRAIEARAAELGLVAERWDQASGVLTSMLGFLDTFMVIAYVLFAIVAVVGITNSILLSVQDRIRDFGTLRAIAFSGRGVSAIIAVEALLLGAGASLLGTLAAWGASAYFHSHGIPIAHLSSEVGAVFPAELNTVTEPLRLAASFAAGTLIPVLAALYPIGLVRKMSIREALGFI